MSSDFRPAIRRLLTDLEVAQAALRDVLSRKRRALHAADVAELERTSTLEGEYVRELQMLLGRRRGILEQAGAGTPAASITDLVDQFELQDQTPLRQQIARIRAAADEIRRETWVHWIVARSLSTHYGELLELIANCGREAATYDERPTAQPSAGGAILDASV